MKGAEVPLFNRKSTLWILLLAIATPLIPYNRLLPSPPAAPYSLLEVLPFILQLFRFFSDFFCCSRVVLTDFRMVRNSVICFFHTSLTPYASL